MHIVIWYCDIVIITAEWIYTFKVFSLLKDRDDSKGASLSRGLTLVHGKTSGADVLKFLK